MHSKERFSTTAGLALAVLALTATPVFGQALKATVLGNITDPSHAVIPGVSVDITEVNTDYHRTEVTNESGFFAFANLDPGTYRLNVAHTGFGKLVRSGLVLDANTTVRVNKTIAFKDLKVGDRVRVIGTTNGTKTTATDVTKNAGNALGA